MAEWLLSDNDEFTTPSFYADREHAPHLEQDGHRQRLLATAKLIGNAAELGATSLVDLGCGDGGLLQAVRELGIDLPAWGYDLQPSNVAASKQRGVSVEYYDFLNEWIRWGDVAVCSEVLEHLVDPHGFVRRIYDAGCRWFIASSPYTETGDSHYELHVWAWDMGGYRAMIENGGWRVIDTRTAWISQIILAERA